jgi:predicted lysophospholipase L1 biosynthesis ABC-type transport system permease subunit
VTIVDQTAAAQYWPGANPIGRRLRILGNLCTVIGVVGNTKHQFVNEQPEPMVYQSFFQGADETTVMVRTNGDPTALGPVLKEAIYQVNRQLPVFDVHSLRETTRLSSSFAVMESVFAGIFAAIALVLAATGVYGVTAFRTQLRTHEMGIRMALGASRNCILRLVLAQGMKLTSIGIALGLALSFGLTRAIAGLLYGIGTNDPLTIIGVVALLIMISLLACSAPAYRAMRVDPVKAIREL